MAENVIQCGKVFTMCEETGQEGTPLTLVLP